MGCFASSARRNSSAGGQLEQPSEVNSSTNTGVGAWAAEHADMPAIKMIERKLRRNIKLKMSKSQERYTMSSPTFNPIEN
jgi:hypothetical protein